MPRIDDYKQALELAKDELKGRNAHLLARLSGADIDQDRMGRTFLYLPFLGDSVQISWPGLEMRKEGGKQELALQQEILVLHYLQGAWAGNGPAPTGDWCAFQDIPDGRFYLDAFTRRAKMPLLKAFGEDPERLIEAGRALYGAEPLDHGDVSIKVKAFPLVSVALILWKGDEEFPPEANILFDRNISQLLSAEDVAWLAGMTVYPLMAR